MTKEIVVDGVTYVKSVDLSGVNNEDGLPYCIVRTYSAGVWAGYVDIESEGTYKTVYNARRLWRWWSDFTLSELAIEGQMEGKSDENKYAIPVPKVVLSQVIEIIPCSKKAMDQIVSTPNYSE